MSETPSYTLKQLGIVHSPYKDISDTPKCGNGDEKEGIVEIFPEFTDCLKCLEEEKFIHLICWLDKAQRDVLSCHPRRDPANPITGVFGTRSPSRPNPISCSLVEVLEISANNIKVKGLDLFDGTPLLDIKPFYFPFDKK